MLLFINLLVLYSFVISGLVELETAQPLHHRLLVHPSLVLPFFYLCLEFFLAREYSLDQALLPLPHHLLGRSGASHDVFRLQP